MRDLNAVEIYVDGSAPKQNPGGPCGVAGVIKLSDEPDDFKIIFEKGYYRSNSMRAEILACIEAFRYVRNNIEDFKGKNVIIMTDSEIIYKYKNMVPYWQQNGWIKSDGTFVQNKDLWKKFYSQTQKVCREGIYNDIHLVKGKSSAILKKVDKLAKKAAENPIMKDFDFQPGEISPSKIFGGSSVLFKPNGQEFIIMRVYEKKYDKSHNLWKIKFDLFSKKEKKFVNKCFAYVSEDKIDEIHRWGCYNVNFNNNNIPIIRTVKSLKKCP